MIEIKKEKKSDIIEKATIIFNGIFLLFVILSTFYFNTFPKSIIIAFLIINVFLLAILPKFFKNNKIIQKYKNGMQTFAFKLNQLILKIILLIVYFIGVGFSWVIVKFTKKKLIDKSNDKYSYWIKKENQLQNFEEMI